MPSKNNSFHIYTSVPKEFNDRVIRSNDAWFDIKTLERFKMKEEVKSLVQAIDNCQVTDMNNWVMSDQFGVPISMSGLSTGCKTAINMLYYSNHLINGIEAGGNAVKAILTLLPGGNILFNSPVYFLDEFEFSVPTYYHSDNSSIVQLNTYYELCDLLASKFDQE